MGVLHTPGPWEFGTRDDGFEHVSLASVFNVPTLPTEDGKGQAWGYVSANKPCFECSEEERLANAHLMAAAPELLAALKLGLEYWAHRQQRYKNRQPAWVQAARAAITKAEGQSDA